MSDFSSTQPTETRQERSMVMRILTGLLWYIPIVFLVFSIAGGIAGGMSVGKLPENAPTSAAEAFEQGAVVGRQASQDMVRAHGGKLFLVSVLLTFALGYTGKLPGTGRYKRRRS